MENENRNMLEATPCMKAWMTETPKKLQLLCWTRLFMDENTNKLLKYIERRMGI